MAFRNISVAITGDVSQYQAALQRASAMTRQFKATVNSSQQSVTTGNPAKTNAATQAQNNYTKSVQATTAAATRHAAALDHVDKKGTSSQKHLAAVQLMVRDAMEQSAGATNIFSKGLSIAKSMIKQLVAVSAGFLVIHGFVNAVGNAVRFMNRSFLDFNDSMTESMAIMTDADRKMSGALQNQAEYVSEITAFSPAEAAKGLYFLSSAGLTASQSIKLLPTAARFAQAGLMDLEKATEMLLDTQKAFNQLPSAEDIKKKGPKKAYANTLFDPNDIARTEAGAKRVTDVITKAAVDSNATIQQIGEGLLNKLAGQARLIGMPIEEAAAMLEALASQGVKGQVAGTYSQMALRDLQRTAIKNADKYAQYGIKVFDDKGEVRRIDRIVKDFESKMTNMSDKQRRVFLTDLGFQDRSVSALLALIGKGEELTNHINANVKQAGGFTKTVAERQLDSIKKSFKLVSNWFARLSNDIGDGLLEGLSEAGDRLRDPIDKAQKALKKLWNALSPVVSVLGKALGGAMIGGITALSYSLQALAGLMDKFPGVFATFITLFAANKLKNLSVMQNIMTSFTNTFGMKGGIGAFMMGQGGMFSKGIGKMTASLNAFRGVGVKELSFANFNTGISHTNRKTALAAAQFTNYTDEYISQLQRVAIAKQKWKTIFKDGFLPSMGGTALKLWTPVNLVRAIAYPVEAGFKQAGKAAWAGMNGVWDAMKKGYNLIANNPNGSFLNQIKSMQLFQRSMNSFKSSAFVQSMVGAKNAVTGFIKNLYSGDLFTSMGMKAATFVNPIITKMQSMKLAMTQLFSPGIMSGLSLTMRAMLDYAKQGFINLGSTMSSSFSTAFSSIKSNMSFLGSIITGTLKDPFGTMRFALNSMTSNVGRIFSSMGSGFKSLGSKVSNISNVFSNMKNLSFKSLTSSMSTFFTNFRTSAATSVKSFFSNWGDAWKRVGNTYMNGRSMTKNAVTATQSASQLARVNQAREIASKEVFIGLQEQEMRNTILKGQLQDAIAAKADQQAIDQIKNQIATNNLRTKDMITIQAEIQKTNDLAEARILAAKAAHVSAGNPLSTFQAPTTTQNAGAAVRKGFAAAANVAQTALMVGMMVGPAMLSDWDNKMNDAKTHIEDKLKEFGKIDVNAALSGESYDDMKKALDWMPQLMKQQAKEMESIRTDGGEIFLETLLGPFGYGNEGKKALAQQAELNNEYAKLGEQRLRLMKFSTQKMIAAKKDKNKNSKEWLDGMGAQEVMDALGRQVTKMGGSLTRLSDIRKAYAALQEGFVNKLKTDPSADIATLQEDMVAAAEDGNDAMKQAAEDFQKTLVDMFGTKAIMDSAHELADLLRGATKSASSVISDAQSKINDDMKKSADDRAKAINDGIDNQIKAIEKQKDAIQKAASKQKKKTKSDAKKERIDDATQESIDALDAEKEALQDNKKESSDFAQERQITLSEIKNSFKTTADESQKLQYWMTLLANAGASTELIQSFKDMGDEALPLLQQFTGKSAEEIKAWVDGVNVDIARLGTDKPKLKMSDVIGSADKMGYSRSKFIQELNMVAAATKMSPQDIERMVTNLGPDAVSVVEDFLTQYEAAMKTGNVNQVVDQFKEMNDKIFNADNFGTDLFTGAMEDMMSVSAGILQAGGSNLTQIMAATGSDLVAGVLRDAATLEAAAGTGETRMQKLYYQYSQQRNKDFAGQPEKQSSGLVPGGTFTPSVQSPNLNTEKDMPAYTPDANRNRDAELRKTAIQNYNSLPFPTFDQWSKFWGTNKAAPYSAIYWKALDKKASVQEIQSLLAKAKVYGRYTQWQGGKQAPIPAYAQGAIVNKPTVGVFGEAGPEVILPLNKKGRMIELLMQSLGMSGDASSFANGGIFGDVASTRSMMASVSSSGSSSNQPGGYGMIGAGRNGPAQAPQFIPVPVPIESKTEWQFNGPIQGLTLEQVQMEADRKRRQRNLV